MYSDLLKYVVNADSVDGAGVSRLPLLHLIFNKMADGESFYSDSFTHKVNFKSVHEAIEWYKNLDFKFVECFQFLSTEALLVYDNDQGTGVQDRFVRLVYRDYGDHETQVFVYGDIEFVNKIREHKLIKEEGVDIIWSYSAESGQIKNKTIPLFDADPIHDEYYPFIEGGVDKFIDEYLSHKAPILVFIGEPGTGKTSLIRNMIHRKSLQTKVTFDDHVMASDSYYIDYMTDPDSKLMVVEDADLLLSSRESDQNRVMSKLLNISDGIVKLVRKKIIFTTNLSNTNRIDPALTRPGRCFKVVEFRKLSHEEMIAAAKKAGLPPVSEYRKEYALSEIFNNQIDVPVKHKIGF